MPNFKVSCASGKTPPCKNAKPQHYPHPNQGWRVWALEMRWDELPDLIKEVNANLIVGENSDPDPHRLAVGVDYNITIYDDYME